jgi:hypothetical protein
MPPLFRKRSSFPITSLSSKKTWFLNPENVGDFYLQMPPLCRRRSYFPITSLLPKKPGFLILKMWAIFIWAR